MFTVVEGAYYNVCIIHRVAVDPFGYDPNVSYGVLGLSYTNWVKLYQIYKINSIGL